MLIFATIIKFIFILFTLKQNKNYSTGNLEIRNLKLASKKISNLNFPLHFAVHENDFKNLRQKLYKFKPILNQFVLLN